MESVYRSEIGPNPVANRAATDILEPRSVVRERNGLSHLQDRLRDGRCESMWKPFVRHGLTCPLLVASSVEAFLLHRRPGCPGRFVPLLRSVRRPHWGERSSTGAMLGPRRCVRWRVGP